VDGFGARVSSVLLLCSNKNPVCKPSIQNVRNITGETVIVKSCFKIQENQVAVDLMMNAMQSI